MEELALVTLMSTLVLLSAVCSIALGKLKLPSLIGFLVAGIIIANTMTLNEDAQSLVKLFSDLGMILLMFSIGMEIDVRKLRSQGKFALVVSLIQLPLMVLGGMLVGNLLGYNALQSLCLGCIISGSSTAVVLAVLKSHGKLKTADVDMLILIVIIEDIGQVIMLSMLTPMLGGGSMSTDSLIVLIIEIAIFMIACFTVGLYVVPRIIDWCSERTNSELISLLCLGIAFALALAAKLMGLSIAIGAFLGGVFVGMTKPHKDVEHFVEPLKSVFMAMFFVSVGMEVVIGSLVDNIVPIIVIFAAFTIVKTCTVFLGFWVGNGDSRVGFISAVSLCAMGEFAFIIAKQALDAGAVDGSFYSSVIGAALLSMVALPFLGSYSDKIYDGAVAKMPGFLSRFFAALTSHRDKLYAELSMVSNRTRVSFHKGLANAYFLIFLVVIVEVIFFYSYDPLCTWLVNNFGMDDHTWRIIILVANLLILLLPLTKLVSLIRYSLYVLDAGKRNLAKQNDEISEDKAKFHEVMSPFLIGAILDIIIVLLVPNGIDNMTHIYVSAAVLAVLILLQIRRIKANKTGPLPRLFEDGAEPQPENPSEEQALETTES